ncbi:MAG: flagellar hook-associated protein FlgK [Calditrichaeota bacterium]|nr:flagellar hook-associated protein FlgK [Calditrichota bacterium]
MPSVGNLMEIARRALSSQQIALTTTGHNIANANTENYSRQRVEIQPTNPLQQYEFFIGTGADVSAIKRVSDQFINAQLNQQQQSLGWFETMESKYTQLEEVFGEPSEVGLSEAINNLFDSWNNLANNPDDLSARDIVLHRAQSLAQRFNSISARLTNIQDSIKKEFSNSVDEFNRLSKQVADINLKIVSRSGGSNSGDLLDQRDILLKRMSELANIKISESDNGQVMLSLNGKVFLQRNNYIEMEMPKESSNLSDLKWSDSKTPVSLQNGIMAALTKFHDEVIPESIEGIDSLAVSIAENVNSIHETGYGLDGSTSNRFFDPATTNAANIKVDQNIVADVRKIATSSDLNNGNGDLALQISQIQDKNFSIKNSMATFSDYFANMIASIGSSKQEATANKQGQQLFVGQLEEDRQAISGVSLDEEMTNLVNYQKAFQAAARLVTLADDLADTVLNMV